MKKNTLAAALAAAVATGPAWSQTAEAPQVYGQIRLTANSVTTGSTQKTELRDNASRLGVKGSRKIGHDLVVLYGAELGVEADVGNLTSPNFRNSYVGLAQSWGTVAMGRLDSANPTGSPLYSQVTAITSFAPNDAGATAIGTSMLNSRNRVSNAVGYMSPKLGDVTLRARYYLRGATSTPDTESGAKSLDLGLQYDKGPLKLAVGYGRDSRPGGVLANELESKWQAGARYAIGAFEPYALVGRDNYRATTTTRADVGYWIAGTRWRDGVHSVVVNVMERDVQSNRVGVRKRSQLGYMYALDKNTELQAFVDRDGIDSSKSNVAVRAFGVGIRHDF